MIEVAIQRHDMIRAPVRVRVAARKISCKRCGREYSTSELAMLTLCESCGSDLAQVGIAVETIQHVIVGTRGSTADECLSEQNESQMAARISIKRYEIRSGANNTRPDSNYVVSATRSPAAAWIKVA